MYSTEAIILHTMPIREHDGFFTFYTRAYGKMRAYAQGVKKERAKLRGHLEPLTLSSVRFVLGKGGERLIGAEMLAPWLAQCHDLGTLRTAWRMARQVDKECLPGERDEQLWAFLVEQFSQLSKGAYSSKDLMSFEQAFERGLHVCLGHE